MTLSLPCSSHSVISAEFVTSCIVYAREHAQGPPSSPADSTSKLNLVSNYTSSASTDPPSHAVSKHEAIFYYSGISPTPPKLVYRTGSSKAPWIKPTGLEAYRRLKQVRGVFGHKLNLVWSDVGPRARDLLKAQGVAWTSIDVARFVTKADDDQEIRGPVVLWIGVVPDSLQPEDAFASANKLLALLAEFGIDDVEVEYRESLYKRFAGSPLLRSVSDLHPTVDVRGPLTPALGLAIATSDQPDAESTMALYFAEGGQSDKVLGLTCRHVLFKTDDKHNDEYVFRGAGTPPKYVRLLGFRRFKRLLASIKVRIGRYGIMIDIYRRRLKSSRQGSRVTTTTMKTSRRGKSSRRLESCTTTRMRRSSTSRSSMQQSGRTGVSQRSAPSVTSATPPPSRSMPLPEALLLTGVRSSSMVPSSRARSGATSSISVRS